MKPRFLLLLAVLGGTTRLFSADPAAGASPTDHLPPHIQQVTFFGERADWSLDGTKILFLSKIFGDAMELDLSTGRIRNLTAHYPHYGYTRALYLANGDILLSGPVSFDPKQAGRARRECYLFLLGRDGRAPAAPLGVLCSEGPAVSRHQLRIAWTEWSDPPSGSNLSLSKLYTAEVVYTGGVPALANRRLVKDGADLPFRCTMETQNFNPANEQAITFSAYTDGGQKCTVMGLDLATGAVRRFTDSPAIYNEPEGIFPDGKYTLVECDEQHPGGPGNIDLWKLALDGSGAHARLTYFSDFPGYKASNGVVSDDGRLMAFQMGKAGDPPGIGHGIFVLDLTKAPSDAR